MKRSYQVLFMICLSILSVDATECKYSKLSLIELNKTTGSEQPNKKVLTKKGGGWAINLKEECYLGFVIRTTKGNDVKTEYHWSPSLASQYEAKLIYEESTSLSDIYDYFHITLPLNANVNSKEENGVVINNIDLTYVVAEFLIKGARAELREGDIDLEMDKVVNVIKLSDEKNEISIGLVITANKNKAEQGGADQPATAPELKSEGIDKPQPESKVRPR